VKGVRPHRTFLIYSTFITSTSKPSLPYIRPCQDDTNSSQWSAGGTFGDQTKHDPTSSRFTAAGTRQQRGQTDTFMSGLSDYRQTVSFSAPLGADSNRPRFTNRMAVEEEEEEEEWEMKDRKASGDDDSEEVKTPTTATSSHHCNEEGMGSTVHLNQVNVLDKGRN
jgi:hypothetical protein